MTQAITNSVLAEKLVHDEMHGLDHEETWAVFLTAAKTVICKEMISMGALKSTVFSNQRLLRRALLNNAAGIILFHNHPSGNPTPSVTDLTLTGRLKEACIIMDIDLIDHIIVTDDSYFSFASTTTYYHNGTSKPNRAPRHRR